MEQTLTPARKLSGEATVPGEFEVAAEALALASLTQEESRIGNAPPSIDRVVDAVRTLGARVERTDSCLHVQGMGLGGWRAPSTTVDLSACGEAALPLLAVLAGQPFPARVRLDVETVGQARQLIALLASMGAQVGEESEGVFRTEGATPSLRGAEFVEEDIPRVVKLALLAAGMLATGRTTLREPVSTREKADHLLRARGVDIEGTRGADRSERCLAIEGGQPLGSAQVEVPGELPLALPILTAAVSLRGSKVTIKDVAVRSSTRGFLDLARQLGADVEMQQEEGAGTDLLVKGGRPIKATRIAEKRAERLLEHVPLLAVLATQSEGAFVIRDVEALRRDREYDYLAHLVSALRSMGAKVGEYPEGIVVEGGHALKGVALHSNDDPGLVQAFAVAAMLAHGETVIHGTECLDGIFPGLFDTLNSLKGGKR